jgi:hypothetical protein
MAKAKKKVEQSGPRKTILSMRGYHEWDDWLTRFAEHLRATRAGAIDRALTELAKRTGFEAPPPR